MTPQKDIHPTPPDTPAPQDLAEASATDLVHNADLESIALTQPSPAPIRASDIMIEQSRIQGKPLSTSTLPNARLTDTAFDRADLSGSTWADARLTRVEFNDCKLTGLDVASAVFTDTRFKDCKAPDLLFAHTVLTRVRFENCQLTGLDFTDATIVSAAIINCDARNLRLINTKITHLDLRGSLIEGLAIDHRSLPNIIISPAQAPALAAALGTQIAD